MFSKMNKSENFTSGFICILHTFDHNLKLNPYICALTSEDSADNITPWSIVKYFNHTF